jgi:uncharacterized protein (DUF1330 family)
MVRSAISQPREFEEELAMSVYMIAGVTIHDPATWDQYFQRAMASLDGFKCTPRVLCDENDTVEGPPSPGRLIIIEFDDRDEFNRWYASDKYTAARPFRHASATTDQFWLASAL